MPRNLDNSIAQRLFENHRQLILVNIDLASAPIYMHSGFGEVLFKGNYYYGVSAFGSITVRTEEAQVNPQRITLTLSGADKRFINEIQENLNYQNRSVYIYKALVDDNYQLIGTQGQLWYRGTTGNATIDEQPGSTISVSLDVNNFLARWDRPSNLRYNTKTWAALYPGDTIMQYVVNTQGQKLWKAATA